ncbi:MAG: Na(+)/H(+) antiporter subunit B [Steroidobacteraceae bacterium]
MRVLVASLLLMTALAGTLVVLSRIPRRQILALASYGVVLASLFAVLQAPDVALSEIVIGAAITPTLFLVTLAALRMDRRRR